MSCAVWSWRGWQWDVPEGARRIVVTPGGGDPDDPILRVVQAPNLGSGWVSTGGLARTRERGIAHSLGDWRRAREVRIDTSIVGCAQDCSKRTEMARLGQQLVGGKRLDVYSQP